MKGNSCHLNGNPLLNVSGLSLTPLGKEEDRLFLAIISLGAEGDIPSRMQQIISSVMAQYREPIFAIYNMLGIVRSSLEKHECYDTYPYLERISRKCYQTMRASTNLASYFKYNDLAWIPNLQRVNINSLLEDFCNSVRQLVRRTEIGFQFENCEEQIISEIDIGMMMVALLNIIANSCLYTNPGNEIAVRLIRQKSDYVITVSDQGIGMEPQVQQNAFEPFYSFDPDGSPARGVGLGLAIVEQVTNCHNGACLITSEFNRGTTIALKLPIHADPDKKLVVESPLSGDIFNKFSLLYIYLADICGINTVDAI